MPIRPGVPLRQNKERAAVILRGRKPPGADCIVLRVASLYCAGEGQLPVHHAIVAYAFVAEKAVCIREGLIDESLHTRRRIPVRIRRDRRPADAVQPVRTPFKRPNHPVRIPRGELVLPPLHPSSVDSCHVLRTFSLTERTKKAPRPGMVWDRGATPRRGNLPKRRTLKQNPPSQGASRLPSLR